MSEQTLDEFNSIVLSTLKRLEETGNFEVKGFVKNSLMQLDPKQKKEVVGTLNKLMPRSSKFDTGRVAGIIGGIALWAFTLDDFAMTASSDEVFRAGIHKKLTRMTRMKKEDFFEVFDRWDEMVGGFQKFRSLFDS